MAAALNCDDSIHLVMRLIRNNAKIYNSLLESYGADICLYSMDMPISDSNFVRILVLSFEKSVCMQVDSHNFGVLAKNLEE